MELTSKITALCVVGVILSLVIKRAAPEQALLLVLCAAAVGLMLLADPFRDVLAFLRELEAQSGIPTELFAPLYKTLGIGIVVKLGSGLCRDAGGGAMASIVETAGTVCALAAALPLLRAVMELVMELIG